MTDKLSLEEMKQIALREKLMATIPKPGICMDCGTLPKVPGRHKCTWCALNKLSPDEQISLALQRQAQAPADAPRTRPKSEWPEGHRWCGNCKTFVGLGYVRGSTCRGCSAAKTRQRVWQLTPEQSSALQALSGGSCQGCLRHQRDRALAVDHQHMGGEIRGLLCKECNHDIIGTVHDDALRLLRLAVYLTAPPADKILQPEKELSDRDIQIRVFEMLKTILEERRGSV